MALQNEDTKDTILRILSDSDAQKILQSIKIESKSTSQLCIECNIPPSTAYRKMQRLFDCGFIHRFGIINKEGKRESFYKSKTSLVERFSK